MLPTYNIILNLDYDASLIQKIVWSIRGIKTEITRAEGIQKKNTQTFAKGIESSVQQVYGLLL